MSAEYVYSDVVEVMVFPGTEREYCYEAVATMEVYNEDDIYVVRDSIVISEIGGDVVEQPPREAVDAAFAKLDSREHCMATWHKAIRAAEDRRAEDYWDDRGNEE